VGMGPNWSENYLFNGIEEEEKEIYILVSLMSNLLNTNYP
jgi:hypothetical protein